MSSQHLSDPSGLSTFGGASEPMPPRARIVLKLMQNIAYGSLTVTLPLGSVMRFGDAVVKFGAFSGGWPQRADGTRRVPASLHARS